MHPEELIALWHTWDTHPSNKAAVNALADAAADYVGDHSLNNLYRHVAAERRGGQSIAAAIYTWRNEWNSS